MRWIGLALLGIVVAAAVSIAASRLASQQIGLASQPISAGDALAPRATEKAKRHVPPHRRAEPKANTAPSAPSTPPTTSEPPAHTTPSAPTAPPEAEPSHPGGHEGEHGEGADD